MTHPGLAADALPPEEITASAPRSVAAAVIVNSTVTTGDTRSAWRPRLPEDVSAPAGGVRRLPRRPASLFLGSWAGSGPAGGGDGGGTDGSGDAGGGRPRRGGQVGAGGAVRRWLGQGRRSGAVAWWVGGRPGAGRRGAGRARPGAGAGVAGGGPRGRRRVGRRVAGQRTAGGCWSWTTSRLRRRWTGRWPGRRRRAAWC